MPNIQKILQKSHAIVVEDETVKRTCGAPRRGNSAQWRRDESGELRYEWVGAMMMVESASAEPVLRVSDVDRGPCWVVVVTQSLRHPHSSLHSPRRLHRANHTHAS